jgi:hypothetical protein
MTFGLFGVALFPRPVNCQRKAKPSGKFLEMGSRHEIVTCTLIRVIEASHWPGKGRPEKAEPPADALTYAITGNFYLQQPQAMGSGQWRTNTVA